MAENTPQNNTTSYQKIQDQENPNTAKENLKTYENNMENLRQYALSEERASRAGDDAIRNINSKITPPSKYRHYAGFYLAIVGDILDAVAVILIFFFGVGIPAGWIVDIVIDIPLLFLGFKSSKELKKTGSAAAITTEKIKNIEQKITHYRQRYAAAIKMGRKVKVLKKPIRQIAKKLKKVRKIITKSPVGRLVAYIIADLVPVLDLIPFRTIAMRQSYKQEKLAYQEFQALINEDYPEIRVEEIEAMNDIAEIESEAEEDLMEKSSLTA